MIRQSGGKEAILGQNEPPGERFLIRAIVYDDKDSDAVR